ncbi:MAG: response regulator [Fibrobacter sp.]|nr:response regulator [Fibrobacter sp.]
MSKKILVVEDNEDIRILYKRLFRKEKDIEITETSDGESALSIVKNNRFDVLVIDISLPGMSGIELTAEIHHNFPDTKILIATGHDVSRYYDEAKKAGADDVFSKEISMELVDRCRKLMQ